MSRTLSVRTRRWTLSAGQVDSAWEASSDGAFAFTHLFTNTTKIVTLREGELSFAASAAGLEETASNPRLSLASGFGDISSARLSLATTTYDELDDVAPDTKADTSRVEKEDSNEFVGRFADEDDPLAGQEFGGGFDDYDNSTVEQKEPLDLGHEADPEREDDYVADRIPWDLKGKGRALEDDDETVGGEGMALGAEFDDAADGWFGAQGAVRVK